MGASRRQHHRQEAAKRQAGIDATAARIAQERAQQEAQRRYEEAMQAMREQAQALTPDAPPRPIQSTIDASNVGIRTARSRRATTAGLSRGIAQLRIPLNLGGISGSGLNIG